MGQFKTFYLLIFNVLGGAALFCALQNKRERKGGLNQNKLMCIQRNPSPYFSCCELITDVQEKETSRKNNQGESYISLSKKSVLCETVRQGKAI